MPEDFESEWARSNHIETGNPAPAATLSKMPRFRISRDLSLALNSTRLHFQIKPMKKADTVEEYMKRLPAEKRPSFLALHDVIIDSAPGAESCISYGMPAIKLHGVVVYYACWEKHMAIYPMPSALKSFAKELGGYVTSKSTIQFPHGTPIPKRLIAEIVEFRVRENKMKREAKKKKPQSQRRTSEEPNTNPAKRTSK